MLGLIPQASKYQPALTDEDAELFEESEDGFEFAVDDDGLCSFGYQDAAGHTLCSVHSAACDLELDPYKTKPAPCTLWPVMMPDTGEKVIAVMEDAYDFPCNKPRDLANVTELSPGVAEILDKKISPQFTRELNQILRNFTRNSHAN